MKFWLMLAVVVAASALSPSAVENVLLASPSQIPTASKIKALAASQQPETIARDAGAILDDVKRTRLWPGAVVILGEFGNPFDAGLVARLTALTSGNLEACRRTGTTVPIDACNAEVLSRTRTQVPLAIGRLLSRRPSSPDGNAPAGQGGTRQNSAYDALYRIAMGAADRSDFEHSRYPKADKMNLRLQAVQGLKIAALGGCQEAITGLKVVSEKADSALVQAEAETALNQIPSSALTPRP